MSRSRLTGTYAFDHAATEQERTRASAPDPSTFAPGLRLLPSSVRADVRCLYSALRTLDDLVDQDQPGARQRIDAVEQWARGEEAHGPEVRALTALSRRTALSPGVFLDFCAGMRHDLARAVVETEDDFLLYCRRVGGAVGIMLAQLLGTSHPAGETKMTLLGQAMQMTNILRDIDEDATHGRVYIARTSIERFGPPAPGARAGLLRDHIAKADALYEEGREAVPLLSQGRRSMALSAALYREILRQIERQGLGDRFGSVAVPAWRRRLIIARYWLR
jgi:phytoene synthase